MAKYKAFLGQTAPMTPWAFVFVVDPFGASLANASSGQLVYNNGDGTRTLINGSGLFVDWVGGIHWTTLSTLERRAADNALIERIYDLGDTGSNPGSGFANQLAELLLAGNDTITGSTGADRQKGGGGVNSYTSTPGSDWFTGGAGDDTIHIVAASHLDGAVIGGGGGFDTFQLEFSGAYNFITGSFVTPNLTGIDLVRFAQIGELTLTFSSEALRAGQGSPANFKGGPGTDIVVIYGSNNQPLTFTNWTSGQDKVIINAAFGPVAGTNVDDIVTITHGGSVDGNKGNDTLNGSIDGDTLNGGSGNDTLNGDGGNDKLNGGGDDDALNGGADDDDLKGSGGDDTLDGGDGIDTLNGGAGNDELRGGAGNDRLTGGAGNDTFVFNTALGGTSNRDTLTDFSHADDLIQLDDAVFAGIGPLGMLSEDAFYVIGSGLPRDAEDRILYDLATGRLQFDPDGNTPGGQSPITFAELKGAPANVSFDDFFVV